MERTRYRKKAKRIETQLLAKLAMMGQSKFAHLFGVHEATVSRMKSPHGNEKESFFASVSLAVAILEYGVDDTEIVELARRFAAVLTKKKSPVAVEDSQYRMDF